MHEARSAVHWQYAAAASFGQLERDIREFNFERTARHHAYAGVSPSRYLEIIDGFLSEPSEIVPGGNRAQLERLRDTIVTVVEPAFRKGGEVGRAAWAESPRIPGQAEPEEYRKIAGEKGPVDPLERECFIEGFCQAWAETEFHAQVTEIRERKDGR